MYKKKICLLFIVLIAASCKPDRDNSKSASPSDYFDVKKYFGQEIKTLEKRKPKVEKTVSVNGSVETKEVDVLSWSKELAAFVNSDINKSAWRGEFSVKKTDSTIEFQSNNPKIPVLALNLKVQANEIEKIQFIIRNTNLLYSSADTLNYIPGKFYQIKKQQKIWLLQPRSYSITGIIK